MSCSETVIEHVLETEIELPLVLVYVFLFLLKAELIHLENRNENRHETHLCAHHKQLWSLNLTTNNALPTSNV